MENETDVLDWMLDQKKDESIEEIERDTLFKYISAKDFLAVIFCKLFLNRLSDLFFRNKMLNRNIY